MNEIESGLWHTIDQDLDDNNRFDLLNVLADFYEEQGRLDAAELLRLVSETKLPDDVEIQIQNLIGTSDLDAIIRRLDITKARLFACDCAELVTFGRSSYENAIDIARRNALGMVSDEVFNKIKEIIWAMWTNVPRFNSTYQQDRKFAWAVTRAVGASEMVDESNVFVDALMAATNSRPIVYFDGPTQKQGAGWTRIRQVCAASEYLVLGRLVEQSDALKQIFNESVADRDFLELDARL